MGRNNLMMSNIQKLYIPLPQNENRFHKTVKKFEKNIALMYSKFTNQISMTDLK